MKTNVYMLSIAVILLTAVSGRGQGYMPSGQGYGAGMNSCAEFARSYSSNPSLTEDAYFLWAQGFMSGLNAMIQVNTGVYRDFSRGDMASQKMQIRSYCNAHPLTQYGMAVLALYQTLPIAGR